MTQCWLHCKVINGMFSDESVIEVSVGKILRSFVVPRNTLSQQPPNRVKVDVLPGAGVRWAVLPTDYRESIPVEDHHLEPA
jgi:hypothetical protein